MCEAFCRKSRRPPPARHFSAAGTSERSDAQESGRKDGKTQRTRSDGKDKRTRRERLEHGNATRSTNRRTLRREREAGRRKTAGASPPPPPLRLSYANRARKRKRNLNRPASAESLARRIVAAPAARFRRGNARRPPRAIKSDAQRLRAKREEFFKQSFPLRA